MKLYLVGADEKLYDTLEEFGIQHLLISFAAIPKRKPWKFDRRFKWFLDSGAFTAMTTGHQIRLHDYIRYVQEHQDELELYANLDVIGDAKGTYENQQAMEKVGLNPLPAYHYGEDLTYLQMYCSTHEYIALGGVAGRNWTYQRWEDWYREVFAFFPHQKFHAFGVTSPYILARFPFYSADSAAWIRTDIYGAVLTPWGGYSASERTRDKPDHLLNLTGHEGEMVRQWLQDEHSLTPEHLIEDPALRTRLNLKWFAEFERDYKPPSLELYQPPLIPLEEE